MSLVLCAANSHAVIVCSEGRSMDTTGKIPVSENVHKHVQLSNDLIVGGCGITSTMRDSFTACKRAYAEGNGDKVASVRTALRNSWKPSPSTNGCKFGSFMLAKTQAGMQVSVNSDERGPTDGCLATKEHHLLLDFCPSKQIKDLIESQLSGPITKYRNLPAKEFIRVMTPLIKKAFEDAAKIDERVNTTLRWSFIGAEPDKPAQQIAKGWKKSFDEGDTSFLQETGLVGTFAQGLGCLSEGANLSDRQSQAQGAQIAAISSMIIPVWPGGTYRTHLAAAASPVAVDYGFYLRCHLLGADASGNPDASTDTSFELLGNVSLQPGISSTSNPGTAISAVAPTSQSWNVDLQIPISGASVAITSIGNAVLSQTINFTPAFVYLEPILWNPVASTSGVVFAITDDIKLIDLSESVNSKSVIVQQFAETNITDPGSHRVEVTYTSPANTSYTFSQYLVVSTAGTGGNLTASLQYQDQSGHTQTSSLITVDAATLGSADQQVVTIQATAGSLISIDLFFNSCTGNPAVSWQWTLETKSIA